MVSDPTWYMVTATILFGVGLYPLLTRRNMIQIVIGIEILTFAANLNFLAVGRMIHSDSMDALGEHVVMVSIVLGACVAAIALLLIIQAHKHSNSVDVKELRRLRW